MFLNAIKTVKQAVLFQFERVFAFQKRFQVKCK